MDADKQRQLYYFENKLGRSTFEDNAEKRSITIDWNKNKKCYKDHSNNDLKAYIA